MWVFKVFSKEGFKVRLCDGNGVFITMFILNLFDINKATEKWGSKQDTNHPNSARGFEMVLTLLTKVVAFYVKLAPVGFQDPSLKKALSSLG